MTTIKNRAHYLMRTQQYDKALDLLLEAIERERENAQLYHLAGRCYLTQRKTAQAIDFLQQATLLDEERAEYHTKLANAYELAGEPKKALESYQRAFNTLSDMLYVSKRLAFLQERLAS